MPGIIGSAWLSPLFARPHLPGQKRSGCAGSEATKQTSLSFKAGLLRCARNDVGVGHSRTRTENAGAAADAVVRFMPPSYAAKAGYPARCRFGDRIEMPGIARNDRLNPQIPML